MDVLYQLTLSLPWLTSTLLGAILHFVFKGGVGYPGGVELDAHG